MHHGAIALLMYIALALELRGVQPMGFACWWLDFVLLLMIQNCKGLSTLLWCGLIGLLSDVIGASPPGAGLLCGATAGLILSSRQPASPMSPLAIAFLLMCWHALSNTLPAAQTWWDLPLTRSLPTFLFAVIIELASHVSEQRRQAALLQASRN